MRRTHHRSGYGMFMTLGTFMLICLSIMALQRLTSTAQTMDVAAKNSGGAVAEELAISTIEEALWRVQSHLQ